MNIHNASTMIRHLIGNKKIYLDLQQISQLQQTLLLKLYTYPLLRDSFAKNTLSKRFLKIMDKSKLFKYCINLTKKTWL